MFTRQFLVASSLFVLAQGQPPSDSITVGQEICTHGYVMDEYCIVSSGRREVTALSLAALI